MINKAQARLKSPPDQIAENVSASLSFRTNWPIHHLLIVFEEKQSQQLRAIFGATVFERTQQMFELSKVCKDKEIITIVFMSSRQVMKIKRQRQRRKQTKLPPLPPLFSITLLVACVSSLIWIEEQDILDDGEDEFDMDEMIELCRFALRYLNKKPHLWYYFYNKLKQTTSLSSWRRRQKRLRFAM